MGIAALFRAVLVKIGGVKLFVEHSSVQTAKMDRAVFEYRDLAVFEEVIILCVFNDCRNVRRKEYLADALTYNKRAFAPNGVNRFGAVSKYDTERKRAAKLMKNLANTADRVAVVVEIQKLGYYLGVGVRQKLGALVLNQKLL